MKTHRTITPAQRDAQFRGATRIGPGIWADADHNLHFSIPELMKHFGWPDDAEHRALATTVISEVIAEQFPGVPVCETDIES